MKKAKVLYDKKNDNLYFFVQEGQLEEYKEIIPGVGVELIKKESFLELKF